MLQGRVNCSWLLKWAMLYPWLSQTLSYEFHFVYELDQITYNKFGRKWTLWTNDTYNEPCNEHNASLNLNCTIKERVIEFKKMSNEITDIYTLAPDAQNENVNLMNCTIHKTGGTENTFNMSVNCSFDGDFKSSTCKFTKKSKGTKEDYNNISFELEIRRFGNRKKYRSKWWCIVNINGSSNKEILEAFIKDKNGTDANVALLVDKSSYMSSPLEIYSMYNLPDDTNATVIVRVDQVSANTSESVFGSYAKEMNEDADMSSKYLGTIGVLSTIVAIYTVIATIVICRKRARKCARNRNNDHLTNDANTEQAAPLNQLFSTDSNS